ncbi:hypothetical protein V6K52_10060 [Knoellia sp. S7-12]|uniref:hypothetical protein n=1 Tax=Knoellia sp. S7-12 TaxID=3126698 RepID=UPI0033682B2E
MPLNPTSRADARVTDADLGHTARALLLLASRSYSDEADEAYLDTPLVRVSQPDVLAVVSAFAPIGRNTALAALRRLERLSIDAAEAMTATALEETGPVIRLTRWHGGPTVVLTRVSDDVENDTALLVWADHIAPACLLDSPEVEIDEVIPALLGIDNALERPLPASARPYGRVTLFDGIEDEDQDDDAVDLTDPRTCSRCEHPRTEADFRAKGATGRITDTRYGYCRECMTSYRRDLATARASRVTTARVERRRLEALEDAATSHDVDDVDNASRAHFERARAASAIGL